MRSSFLWSLALAGALFACSSSSTGSSSNGDSTPSHGTNDCSCSISVNGASQTVACGHSACIGGQSYSCGDDASISQSGTACESPDGGGTTTTTTATTVACPFSAESNSTANDTCNAKTQYCILAKNGGQAATCAPLPTNCDGCDCASDNADAAWKAAKDGTGNCSQTIITCEAKNGAITVTCGSQ